MLTAGVVGCNLEDTDHHDDNTRIESDRQASSLSDVRDVAGV